MRAPTLLTQRVVGGHDQADRGDLATPAAAAVAAGRGVVVVAVQEEPLGVAVGGGGVREEAARRVGGLAEELEALLQRLQQRLVLHALDQGGGAADLDALQAAGALPGVDRRGEEAARSGGVLLHRVEERAGAGDGVAGELVDDLGQVAGQDRLVAAHPGGRPRHDLVERRGLLVVPVGLADPVGEAVDLGAQLLALDGRRVDLGDRGQQEVVDLVDGVGDRRVGAGERALHAAGAQLGQEVRHVAPEQALVLAGRRTARHEETGAGEDRRLGDGAGAERPGDHLLVVAPVEQAVTGGGLRAVAHVGRHLHGVQRQHVGEVVDAAQRVGVVVDTDGVLEPVADDRHVAGGDGGALGAELLLDLLLDLGEDGLLVGAAGEPVHVADDRADEGDAHHPGLQAGRRCVPLGDGEGVDHEEVDALGADGAPCLAGQAAPDVLGGGAGLHDEGAALDQAPERVGVAEDLVVGADHDLDVLEVGVGDQDRLGRQGDVVVGGCAGLLRAVLGRRLGVHAEDPGEDVGEQLAGGDGAVAADGVEPDPGRVVGQQVGVGLGLERHQLGLGVRRPQPLLELGQVLAGGVAEELAAEVDQRRRVGAQHVLVGGHQVPRLQVVATEAEDRGGEPGCAAQRGDAGVPVGGVGVLPGLEERLGDQGGERGLVGALEDGDGLLAGERRDDVGLGEGLQHLDRDQAGLDALAAQVRQHRAGVVGDRAEADHHDVGVLDVVGVDRVVRAAGQLGVLRHRLTGEGRDGAGEVGAVVDRAGLEVGLVLDRPGHAGVVDVDERRHQLAGALLERVAPLARPLPVELLGHPAQGLRDEAALLVGLDLVGVLGQPGAQLGEPAGVEVGGPAVEVLLELVDAPLGAEQHVLRDGRGLDPPGGVAEVVAEQLGLGQQRLAQHVARGEAVHGVGDRDQRERRGPVGDRGEVGRLLGVGAEQDGVAGLEQGVDVVVAGHDVEGVLGDDPGRHLEDEAADLLADGDVVGLHRVEDPLAGGGVGDELPAGQGCAERTTLGRVLALGGEEERVLAEHVDVALGPRGLVELADLGRRGDGVADDAPADAGHHLGHGRVAVDDCRDAGVLRALGRRTDRSGNV